MITLEDNQVREVRRLLQRLLDIIPDPDAPVHARQPTDLGGTGPLCRAPGRLRMTEVPAEVTCKRCRGSVDWEAWRYRRSE